MHEFSVNGKQYRMGKMELWTQWNVVRRMGPMVPSMMVLYRAVTDGMPVQTAIVMVGDQMIEALGTMKDEDQEYIRAKCLEVVEANMHGGWGKIYVAGRMADDTLTLLDALKIMVEVIKETFLPFFSGLAQVSQVETKTPAPE